MVNTVSTVMLPVSLRSIWSPDHRNRMDSVIKALHGFAWKVAVKIVSRIELQPQR